MTVAPTPGEVRLMIAEAFRDFGCPAKTSQLHESLVLDQNDHLARAYDFQGYQALWHIDDGVLEILSEDGEVLRVVNLFRKVDRMAVAA